MRKVLLFVAYFFVVTPYGLVRRLVRDPLQRGRDPRAGSYLLLPGGWSPLKTASRATGATDTTGGST
jgi:hypothetical protein